MDPIPATGPIRRAASLLLSGWGYNLNREENRTRADDLLIRSKTGMILARAKTHLSQLEREYRRIYLPPPTRENPIPDRLKVEQARMIERSARLIEPIMVAIQSAPVPTSDGVWRHHRSEQNTLEVLQGIDIRLVDAAIDFHDFIIELAITDVSAAVLERDVKEKLRGLEVAVQERTERLTLMI
jgi:hypothetical protein